MISIIRVLVIINIICAAAPLFAGETREDIISRALDEAESHLYSKSDTTEVALAEPEPRFSTTRSSQSSPSIVRPPKPTPSYYSTPPTLAAASDQKKIAVKSLDDKPLLHHFEFGTDFFYHQFEEPGLVEQDGYLYGIQGAYTLRTSFNEFRSISDHFEDRDKLNMFRVEAMAAFGTVDFEGTGAGEHKGRENYMWEIRGLAGYDFLVRDDIVLTPYMGFGYRYLRDRSPGRILPFASFSGIFSFERESEYFYIPVGLTTTKKLGEGWTMDFNMEYDFLLHGQQTNHYNDGGVKVNGAFVLDALEFEQDKGFGVRGSLKLTKERKETSFFIEPYIRYWRLRDSETRQFTSESGSRLWFDGTLTIPRVANQPKNNTTEVGLKLGLRY